MIVFSFGIAMPISVKAQALPANYTLLEPLPCIAGTGNNCTGGTTNCPSGSMCSINIQTYIVYIFKLMVALAVFAAVVMCIVGGFEYMLTDSITKKLDAKGTIKNAILGLGFALASYLILYTINPNLVNVSLVTVPTLNLKTTNIDLSPTDINASTDATVAALDRAANAKDQALAQTAQDDQDMVDADYGDLQDAGCVLADGSISTASNCQSLNTQYQADKAQAASSATTAAVSYAKDSDASEIANMAKYTTPDQFAQGITNVKNASALEISKLPNNDLTGKQTILNQQNYTVADIQDQSQVTGVKEFLNGNKSGSITSEENSAIDNINKQSAALEKTTTDPAVQQQMAADAKSKIAAVQAEVKNYDPGTLYTF